MSFTYVHLSDIHFGQEHGGEVIVNRDAKERLIEDVSREIAKLPGANAKGVIVTGDIAYGGKQYEYKDAADWLDKVARAAGCAITDIQVVPGNHDIDRSEMSISAEWMLSEIAQKGEAELDRFLANDRDRALLYARFTSYLPFAEGYNCPLDVEGGLASVRTLELAPGRSLRFIGLNSALVCKTKDAKGELLLGARQRVLPLKDGEELVVLCHHPLEWLQDSADAKRFVLSRARVLITGHEHTPRLRLEPGSDDCHIMILEAGATVPPTASGPFTYTYNLVEFSWDQGIDGLRVRVHPRAWDDNKKRFVADDVRLGGRDPVFSLGCPNYRNSSPRADYGERRANDLRKLSDPMTIEVAIERSDAGTETVPPGYPLTLLRFFRDLTEGQRLAVLVKLGALPDDWSETLPHSQERQIVDRLVSSGRLAELNEAIEFHRRHTSGGTND